MTFDRRLVIDTGVLISAAIRPQSLPSLALTKAFRRFDVCMCDETWSELENVLMRDKFDTYLTPDHRRSFLTNLFKHAQHVRDAPQVNDCIDPKDNKFLALALYVDAEMIVASDPHLTDMHPWRGIPILTPAAFLKLF